MDSSTEKKRRAAEAAAGVDADGEFADRDAAMVGIEAAHHPAALRRSLEFAPNFGKIARRRV